MCRIITINRFDNTNEINYTTDSNPRTIGNRAVKRALQRVLQNPQEEFQVIISDGIKEIGNSAFSGYNLVSVTIPESVTKIGNSAFKNCVRLETIAGMNGVTKIGDEAFFGCNILNQIVLPESLDSVGSGVFCGCRRFRNNVIWNHGNHRLLLFAPVNNETAVIPGGPDGVTKIGDGAFKGCMDMTTVLIPDSVTIIGDNAFRDCRRLNSFGNDGNVLSHVTEIGWFAFSGCTRLNTVRMPAVQRIGDGAFSDCRALTNTEIPQTTNRIGSFAFAGCTQLNDVTIPANVRFVGGGAFSQENLTQESIQSFFAEEQNLRPRIELFQLPANQEECENFILDKMVEGISSHYNEWLNLLYMWPMNYESKYETNTQFEQKTVNDFHTMSEDLAIALDQDNPNQETVEGVIRQIFQWGQGQGQGDDEENEHHNIQQGQISDYARLLNDIRNSADYNRQNHDLPYNDRNFFSRLVEKGGTSNNNYRIAYWSKSLAAYNPGVFFIYDSRVAYALSFISLYLNLPVFWNQPAPRPAGYSAKAIGRFQQTIKTNLKKYSERHPGNELTRELDIQNCYRLYLKLLDRLGNNGFFDNAYTHYETDQINDDLRRGIIDDPSIGQMVPTGNEIRQAYDRAFPNQQPMAIKAHLEKMFFMMKGFILKQFHPEVFFDN